MAQFDFVQECIRGWNHYIRLTTRPYGEHRLLLRGVTQACYQTMPTAGRTFCFNGKCKAGFDYDAEHSLLHRFRRRAAAILNTKLEEWEALLLARHYGLPTRLLDWSSNPLVALYFACEGHQDKDGAVWAIHRRQHARDLDVLNATLHAKPLTDPFLIFDADAHKQDQPDQQSTRHVIKIIYPFHNSVRIVAQDGHFTFHTYPHIAIEDYAGREFADDRLDIQRLFKWTVPAALKQRIIEKLDRLGISNRLIYPDLDGVAKGLWQAEVLYKGT